MNGIAGNHKMSVNIIQTDKSPTTMGRSRPRMVLPDKGMEILAFPSLTQTNSAKFRKWRSQRAAPLVRCLQVLRGLAALLGLQVRGRFQVKLDIAASDIGPRMAQRQVTVDLLQL